MLAKENGAIMLSFPPHTSLKLQPLDRSIYGPFKKYYNSACDKWIIGHPGHTMTIWFMWPKYIRLDMCDAFCCSLSLCRIFAKIN